MAMILAVMILAALAIGLVQLGALSVWVSVLRLGLIVAGVTIVVLVAALFWRRLVAGIRGIARHFKKPLEPNRRLTAR